MNEYNVFILEDNGYGQDIKDSLTSVGINAEWFTDHNIMYENVIPDEMPDLYILVDNFMEEDTLFKRVLISTLSAKNPSAHIIGVCTDKSVCCSDQYSKLIDYGCTNICPMNVRMIKSMVTSLLFQSNVSKTKHIKEKMNLHRARK